MNKSHILSYHLFIPGGSRAPTIRNLWLHHGFVIFIADDQAKPPARMYAI